ncbi:MAG: head-tail adaptor protein [Alphaproteobacteria bacterium]|nr:head-tail adaptor protein [Alphaproteobacteria bacterium]
MIGALRHALRLQTAHRAPDGGGGWHLVWQDVAARPLVYAAIESAGGGEALRQHKRTPAVSHRLRIRYRSDMTAGMRLIDMAGGAAYEIVSLHDAAGDARWLEIAALKKPL